MFVCVCVCVCIFVYVYDTGIDDQHYLAEEAPQMGDDEMAVVEGGVKMEGALGVGSGE
jgi:hypothetical protein